MCAYLCLIYSGQDAPNSLWAFSYISLYYISLWRMWALWVHCLLHIMCKLNEFSGVNTERWFGALRRLVPTLAASFRLLTWIRIPWLTCCWLELQCTWAQKKMSRDESTSTGSRYRKLVQSDNFCQTSAKSHKIKELFLFFLRYRITNLSMSIL